MSTAPQRLGKYELQEQLGRGGMGEVRKAFDTQLHRHVAIKFLHADLRANPDFVSRFTREAQVIASLHHPNIVQIYDFHVSEGGDDSDTLAYMVMDYVKGQTLAHYIQKTSRQKKFPSATEIVRLFTPIGLALDYAHQQGMIHRDIKPANILLDMRQTIRNPMGEPILSDFGLAKLLNTESQTASGTLAGTPLYISPEQLQNHPVSNQTDIYALGVVLYEVVTGFPPFTGETLTGIMMQHLTRIPLAPHLQNSNLPPALSEVLLRSLAKDPRDRFSSASSMIFALAKALDTPVSEEITHALSLQNDTLLSMDQTVVANPSAEALASFPTIVSESPSSASSDVAVTPSSGDSEVSDEPVLPNTSPTIRAEAKIGPVHLPDSEPQLSMPSETVASPLPVEENLAGKTPSQPVMPLPPVLSPLAPPTRPKRRGGRIALIAVLICLVIGSGLGTFFLTRHATTTPIATNSIVGHAFFVSSGHVNETTNQGSNDQLQIDLQHIPTPQSGKSYYAWLLGDTTQSEAPVILLGKVPVSQGNVHFFYAGDGQYTNLLDTSSRFLITEEDANVTPSVPSPDLSLWRYYAELPQTVAPGQTYSLLDHLRHLLTKDPTLEALHLPGGLNIWTYRNTQRVQGWADSARDDWNAKDFASMRSQIVSILDYLDGSSLVQQDVPSGTPLAVDPHLAQIGLLELHAEQNPPGYLYHVALHLNGTVSAPGATQDQRTLAIQINTAVNTVRDWLEQVRKDALQLVVMSDAQLALPSSLNLLNDMAVQANNAYMGHADPSGGMQIGVAQIYLDIQKLASFTVKPYK